MLILILFRQLKLLSFILFVSKFINSGCSDKYWFNGSNSNHSLKNWHKSLVGLVSTATCKPSFPFKRRLFLVLFLIFLWRVETRFFRWRLFLVLFFIFLWRVDTSVWETVQVRHCNQVYWQTPAVSFEDVTSIITCVNHSYLTYLGKYDMSMLFSDKIYMSL